MATFRDEIRKMMQAGFPTSLQMAIADRHPDGEIPPLELPTSECPVCCGTGYVRFDVPIEHENFGKLFECTNPGCVYVARRKAAVMQRRMQSRHGNWTPKMTTFTFDSFREFLRSDEIVRKVPQEPNVSAWDRKRDAYGVAYAFAYFDGEAFTLSEAVNCASGGVWKMSPNDRGHRFNSVVLYGGTGFGKTALGAAAANALLAGNKRVLFTRMKHMTDVVQETYKDAALYNKIDEISVYSGVDYLVLDEFAANNPSKDKIDILETILRERMDLNDRPTLFTTNFKRPSDVEAALAGSDAVDGAMRIVAMLKKCHWIEVGGVQLRPQQTNAELDDIAIQSANF